MAAGDAKVVHNSRGRKIWEGPEENLRRYVETQFPRSHEDFAPDVRLVLPDGTEEVYNAEAGWTKGSYSTENGWTPADAESTDDELVTDRKKK